MHINERMDEFLKDLLVDGELTSRNLVNDNSFSTWESENYGLLWDKWKCHVSYGATKAVFDVPEFAYVIKIPFVGYHTNYCELEVENYNAAVRCGFARYFAETRYYTIGYDDTDTPIEFYIQERCDADESAIIDSITSTLGDEYGSGCSEDVAEWMSQLIKNDDINYDEFHKFLKCNHINDLHSANVAIKNDSFIIFDFSGYKGDSISCSESRNEDEEDYESDKNWQGAKKLKNFGEKFRYEQIKQFCIL